MWRAIWRRPGMMSASLPSPPGADRGCPQARTPAEVGIRQRCASLFARAGKWPHEPAGGGETVHWLERDEYVPDIVIGHNGWGEILFIKDVWPQVPLLGYFEFFYRASGWDVDFDREFPAESNAALRLRTRNAINLLGLNAVDRARARPIGSSHNIRTRSRPHHRRARGCRYRAGAARPDGPALARQRALSVLRR